MRPILTSFLALHWAAVFALLAFICVDGNRGVAGALGALGVAVENTRLADLDNAAVVAPLRPSPCWSSRAVLLGLRREFG